jgi:adenine/guanine phosphoribosyltransferase-like PRPP-binding protein
MIYHKHGEPMDGQGADRWTLDDLSICVADALKALQPHKDEFDTLVCQGMSGVVVATPLSLMLGKKLSIVRKSGEYSHQRGGNHVIGREALKGQARVLFVDDFISMGGTRRRVQEAVTECNPNIVWVGEFTYMDNGYRRRELRAV